VTTFAPTGRAGLPFAPSWGNLVVVGIRTSAWHRRAASAVVLVALAVLLAPGAATAASSAGACVVRVGTYRFDPASAPEGSSTTLRTTVVNCTGVARHVSLTQYGTEPSGCPVLDPVSRRLDLAPHQRVSSDSRWTAPSCAGKLRLHLRVTGSGGSELDHATAVLRVTPA
jgi:hypothetical protein